MDKANAFVADDFDLVDRSVSAEVIPEALLGDGFLQVAQVNITGGSILLNSHYDVDGDGARLSPSDLQLLPMKLDLAHQGIGMKRSSCSRIQERDERAVLLREYLDRVDGAEADLAEELVDRGIRWKIAYVYGSSSLSTTSPTNLSHTVCKA